MKVSILYCVVYIVCVKLLSHTPSVASSAKTLEPADEGDIQMEYRSY